MASDDRTQNLGGMQDSRGNFGAGRREDTDKTQWGGFSRQPQTPAGTRVINQPDNVDDYLMAYLIVKKGARRGDVYRLKKGITSIGRLENLNDITIWDESITEQHAKIRIEDNKYMLYDLVTTNGTKVNGEAVNSVEIKENDEIQIGETILVFKRVE